MLLVEKVDSMNIWKTVWQVLKTLDTYHTIQLFPLPGIYPGETETCLYKDLYMDVHISFIDNRLKTRNNLNIYQEVNG